MGASAAHSGIGYGRSRIANSGYAYPVSGVLTIADDVHSDQNALMRPLINAIRIETPHEGPLGSWVPDDPTHFEAYLTMSIVPDSSEERWLMEHGQARGAGEQFSITVCTPSWMATRLEYEARPCSVDTFLSLTTGTGRRSTPHSSACFNRPMRLQHGAN